MALSFDVNINIGSQLGYTMQTNTNMIVNTPQVQTIMNLNGDVFSTSTYSVNTGPLLSTSLLSDFVFPIFTTSTHQTISMTNIGKSPLVVSGILYSYGPEVGPRFYYTPPNVLTTSTPIVIAPNNTASFEVAYKASIPGVYDNFIIIKSNNASGIYYKIPTHQIAGTSSGFEISPTHFNTTTTHVGQNESVLYSITPVFNTVPTPGVPVSMVTSVSGSHAWRVLSTGTNSILFNFNPNEVNNVNGTYISTLTITANGQTIAVTNTATINIDRSANKNLSTWISPASHYNSIIGISYDLKDNQRYLTIGVGMGGDGVPIYGSGGNIYANVAALGLGAESIDPPYPFWSKVYSIPFSTGTDAQVYNSNDYVVKTTTASDYSSYFGEYHAPGSMFIVEDDGYGCLKIEINHLRDLSDDVDDDLKATLKNLTRAFYYYSNVDLNGRYMPLPTEYSAPIATNTATTYLFVGFNYNTRDKLADVNTSIVELPV